MIIPRHHGGPRPKYALSTKLAYELKIVVMAIGLVNFFAQDTRVPELFVLLYSPNRMFVVDWVEVHAKLWLSVGLGRELESRVAYVPNLQQ